MATPWRENLVGAARRLVARLPKRRVGYWLSAALVFALTIWATPVIDQRLDLEAERNWVFQHLTHSATNPTQPGNVRLVIIRDDAFWKAPLNHRTPTNRHYLAGLMRALKTAGASVIALDFDLRSPLPDPKPANDEA